MKLQRVEAAEFGLKLQSLMGIASSVGKRWPVHEFTCMFLNIGSRSTLASNIGPFMSHSEIRIGSPSALASNIVSQHWFTLSSNALLHSSQALLQTRSAPVMARTKETARKTNQIPRKVAKTAAKGKPIRAICSTFDILSRVPKVLDLILQIYMTLRRW